MPKPAGELMQIKCECRDRGWRRLIHVKTLAGDRISIEPVWRKKPLLEPDGNQGGNMYQRIMVAVDGSNTSTKGLKEAIALAKDQGAKLAIVHVIDIVVVFGAGQFPGTYIEATR